MAVTFCGKPLLLHDPNGDLQAHIDAVFAEEEMKWFGRESPSEAALNQISLQRHPARVPMPVFNWPERPKPKINSLYIPVTGATRWSLGLFLVDGDTWQHIRDAMGDDSSGTFTITDDRQWGNDPIGTTKTATMYALTPRLISQTSDPQLMILPLVDCRYFWQFMSVTPPELECNEVTSWTNLFASFAGSVGQSLDITTAIESDYFYPDPIEFDRQHENAAMMIDAACASTGRRLVFDLFGDNITIQNPEDAEDAIDLIDGKEYDWTAGGYNSQIGDITAQTGEPLMDYNIIDTEGNQRRGETPPAVRVVFPKYVGHLATGDGGVISKRVEVDSVKQDIDQPSEAEWAVFTTAAADMTGCPTPTDPTNDTDLSLLAARIGADFYYWLFRSYDFSCIGLWNYAPSGYEDYHWIHFGSLDKAGNYQAHTRIATLPPNFGAQTNWCQILTGSRRVQLWPGPRLIVRLTEPFYADCSSACAEVVSLCKNDACDDDDTDTGSGSGSGAANGITIHDPLNKVAGELLAVEDNSGTLYIPAGFYCTVTWWNDSQKWIVDDFGKGCPCGSGSSEGSEGSEGSGSGVSGERCWIGEPDGPGGLPHHKQPNKIDAPYAVCGTIYVGTVTCGIAVDDAGHVIGWWNRTGRWFSPWGFPEPTETPGAGIAAINQPYET